MSRGAEDLHIVERMEKKIPVNHEHPQHDGIAMVYVSSLAWVSRWKDHVLEDRCGTGWDRHGETVSKLGHANSGGKA